MKFLISQVIDRDLHDPRIGFVTVLDVEPTADLKEAKVYLSVLGSAAVRSKAEHALADAKGYIQKEVGRGLETRNTPVLRFVFDDSQDRASRIEALIQKASQEDRETTMAKKPSKKPDKASRGGEKSAKKPSRKSPLDEKEENGEGEDEPEAGEEGDADFESDFNEKEEEKAGEAGEAGGAGEAGNDDFDEDVLDEDEDKEEDDIEDGDDFDDEEDEDEDEDEEEEDGFAHDDDAEDYSDDR
jgi:ribosome-binding factor A